jgi:outer membrane protein assembly factor BamB
LRLACLDANRKTAALVPGTTDSYDMPTLLWSQRLGEPKDRLPADSTRRYQGSFLAYADGVLIVSTNTGAIVGLDVMARSLLWAHSYRTREGTADPNVDDTGRIGRRRAMPVNPAGGPVPQARWRASAPIVRNGRVIVTAYDARSINCIDLRTGNLIWYDEMDPVDDLYVGGLIEDRVVVIGSKKARAYDFAATPPDPKNRKVKPVWDKLAIGLPCGHGAAATNGIYYLPVARSTESELPQIWAIDAKKGEIVGKSTFRRKLTASVSEPVPLGNLIFHEGQVFSQTPQEVLSFPLIELKRKAMDEQLRANPKDPAGLAARGELFLDDGQTAKAIADFKTVRAANPPEAVARRVRDKLYQAYTEILRIDFAAGEPFLEEYKTLLEVPLVSDDPAERQRIIDEQLTRKSRYLSLMARGREKQGRLVEAYGYYREFASLGENKQLIAIDGEPYSQCRPDVWARGRIDAMIRTAKDAAAKKDLEALVAKEWDAVRDGKDLARLREFVRIFGPYFAAGQQAQFKLAESLLATADEDHAREAEALLSNLVASAPDGDAGAARAADTLAGSLLKKQLFEDAVALYGQIGTRFAATTIRDGKTGRDLLSDLLIDRRLLPYLEATRPRAPGPAKVERRDGHENRPQTMSFTVEPEGTLLPFYDRYRISIEMNANGSPNWMLKVEDKTSKQVRCKFEGLYPPANFNINPSSGSWSDIKFAQADGHVLMLHLGIMVYAFDLAEKKCLWQYNLLAGSAAPPPMRSQTVGNDGEVSILFEDGWMVRLGRSAAIRNGVAGLLTRDGLVALDLRTGQKLWQQGGISPRSIIFGDGQYFLLADPGDGGKPMGKVLRAVDGTAVEGLPEFAKFVTGSNRIKIVGRSLLMFELAGSERVLRLYDPIAGKDLWSLKFDKEAKTARCFDGALVGIVEASGAVHLIDATTGKRSFQAKFDPALAKETVAGQGTPNVLLDSERVFVLLQNGKNSNRQTYYYGQQGIRMLAVNGQMICFDRAKGEMKWFTRGQFEQQQLVLDRFHDLPVLLAAMNGYDQNTGVQSCEVIALDKDNGKVKFRDTRLSPNGPFQSLELDAKTGSFELKRYDTKIVISPVSPTRD